MNLEGQCGANERDAKLYGPRAVATELYFEQITAGKSLPSPPCVFSVFASSPILRLRFPSSSCHPVHLFSCCGVSLLRESADMSVYAKMYARSSPSLNRCALCCVLQLWARLLCVRVCVCVCVCVCARVRACVCIC